MTSCSHRRVVACVYNSLCLIYINWVLHDHHSCCLPQSRYHTHLDIGEHLHAGILFYSTFRRTKTTNVGQWVSGRRNGWCHLFHYGMNIEVMFLFSYRIFLLQSIIMWTYWNWNDSSIVSRTTWNFIVKYISPFFLLSLVCFTPFMNTCGCNIFLTEEYAIHALRSHAG